MDIAEVLKLADELIFAKTGEHLDYLQKAILHGTIQDKTYPEIAEEVYSSSSHVRNVGSELWKILSEGLGEDITKANFRAILEKSNFYNYQSAIVENIKGENVTVNNKLNICPERARSPTKAQNSQPTPKQLHIDLGDAPEISSSFYDRTPQLSTLKQWILHENTRLVAILGITGIGKTAIAVNLVEQIKHQFDYILWRSLSTSPPLQILEKNIIQFLSQPQAFNPPNPPLSRGGYDRNDSNLPFSRESENSNPPLPRGENSHPPLPSENNHPPLPSENNHPPLPSENNHPPLPRGENSHPPLPRGGWGGLIDYLRKYRCLLILDDVQTINSSGKLAGNYQPEYEDYGTFFKQIGELSHNSCLILISSEKSKEISILEGENQPVRSLQLSGLGAEAIAILREKRLADEEKWLELIEPYRGNPLWLKILATMIQDVFNGSVAEALSYHTLFLGDLEAVLHQSFHRLSESEKQVMSWLASEKLPVSLTQIPDRVQLSHSELLKAIQSLGRRDLIEKIREGERNLFTLQPVIKEYVKTYWC